MTPKGKLSSVALLAGMAVSEVPPWSHEAWVAHEASEGWHRGADPRGEAREVLSAVHAMATLQLRAARMAAARGSDGVRAFARGLAASQEGLDARVRRTARSAGVAVEGAEAEAQAWRASASVLRRLGDTSGAAFDAAYLDWVAAAGRSAVEELQEEAREPEQTAAVRDLLAAALPELRREIAQAVNLRTGAAPGGRGAGRRPHEAFRGTGRPSAATAGPAASRSWTR